MRRLIVLACVLASLASACSKSKHAPEGGGSGSAAAGSASPTGAGSSVDTTAIDAMVDDMMAYTEKVVPMLLAFDGDCAAQAKRMLELEPLVQKIRAEGTALESDPAAQAAVKAAMESKKPAVMARLKAKLDAAGTTEDAVGKMDKALNEKCGSDPVFQDALKRVGLRRKKG